MWSIGNKSMSPATMIGWKRKPEMRGIKPSWWRGPILAKLSAVETSSSRDLASLIGCDSSNFRQRNSRGMMVCLHALIWYLAWLVGWLELPEPIESIHRFTSQLSSLIACNQPVSGDESGGGTTAGVWASQ